MTCDNVVHDNQYKNISAASALSVLHSCFYGAFCWRAVQMRDKSQHRVSLCAFLKLRFSTGFSMLRAPAERCASAAHGTALFAATPRSQARLRGFLCNRMARSATPAPADAGAGERWRLAPSSAPRRTARAQAHAAQRDAPSGATHGRLRPRSARRRLRETQRRRALAG